MAQWIAFLQNRTLQDTGIAADARREANQYLAQGIQQAGEGITRGLLMGIQRRQQLQDQLRARQWQQEDIRGQREFQVNLENMRARLNYEYDDLRKQQDIEYDVRRAQRMAELSQSIEAARNADRAAALSAFIRTGDAEKLPADIRAGIAERIATTDLMQQLQATGLMPEEQQQQQILEQQRQRLRQAIESGDPSIAASLSRPDRNQWWMLQGIRERILRDPRFDDIEKRTGLASVEEQLARLSAKAALRRKMFEQPQPQPFRMVDGTVAYIMPDGKLVFPPNQNPLPSDPAAFGDAIRRYIENAPPGAKVTFGPKGMEVTIGEPQKDERQPTVTQIDSLYRSAYERLSARARRQWVSDIMSGKQGATIGEPSTEDVWREVANVISSAPGNIIGMRSAPAIQPTATQPATTQPTAVAAQPTASTAFATGIAPSQQQQPARQDFPSQLEHGVTAMTAGIEGDEQIAALRERIIAAAKELDAKGVRNISTMSPAARQKIAADLEQLVALIEQYQRTRFERQ